MSRKIKWLASIVGVVLLVATRFVGLDWGLPYPFHPDERNMAVAIQSLSCSLDAGIPKLEECLNPHFFAYGQFPLYLGYLIIHLVRMVTQRSGALQFGEAVMSLRLISAITSLGTVFTGIKILQLISKDPRAKWVALLIFIFSPALIQFAHFGTTESLLMFFYTSLTYLSLKVLTEKNVSPRIYVYIGVVAGLAVATKVSSLSFLSLPVVALVLRYVKTDLENKPKLITYEKFWNFFNELVFMMFAAGVVAVVASPHNIISWKDFISSFMYESAVGTGAVKVFYTRSFEDSIPLLFQIQHIFPYALGLPVFVASILGLVVMPWDRRMNFLRFALLIFLIPWSFFFTKWTRFMAPIFPLMIIFAVLFILRFPKKLLLIIIPAMIIPGIIFLKLYTQPDVRFIASQWMQTHIPKNSFILQEGGNVVDLPTQYLPHGTVLKDKEWTNVAFDFYNLERNTELQQKLPAYVNDADYIIVPSRRIFKNHPKDVYPITYAYYEDLFTGKSGFSKVAEFKTLHDEEAEETWTVFDHPVIRIYKKN